MSLTTDTEFSVLDLVKADLLHDRRHRSVGGASDKVSQIRA